MISAARAVGGYYPYPNEDGYAWHVYDTLTTRTPSGIDPYTDKRLYVERDWYLECHEEKEANRPPITTGSIPDQEFLSVGSTDTSFCNSEGRTRFSTDLSRLFEDPDGDALTYNVTGDRPWITASIVDSALSINALETAVTGNTTTITVTASDGKRDGDASLSFNVNIIAEGTPNPVLSKKTISLSLETEPDRDQEVPSDQPTPIAQDSYSVTLSCRYRFPVTVEINNTAAGSLRITPTTLRFNDTNWNVPQTVRVETVGRVLGDGITSRQFTLSHVAATTTSEDRIARKSDDLRITVRSEEAEPDQKLDQKPDSPEELDRDIENRERRLKEDERRREEAAERERERQAELDRQAREAERIREEAERRQDEAAAEAARQKEAELAAERERILREAEADQRRYKAKLTQAKVELAEDMYNVFAPVVTETVKGFKKGGIVGAKVGFVKGGLTSILNNSLSYESLNGEEDLSRLAQTIYVHQDALEDGSITLDQALSGQSFSIPFSLSQASAENPDASPRRFNALFSSGVDYSKINDRFLDADIDGSATTFNLGINVIPNPDVPLLAGLQLAYTRSQSDIERKGVIKATHKMEMLSLYPSVAWDATDNLTLWTSLGYGWPTTEFTVDSIGDGLDIDTSLTDSGQFFSFAGGANYRVWQSDASALSLNLSGSTASFLDDDFQQGSISTSFSHDFTFDGGKLSATTDLAMLLSSSDPSTAELSGNLNWLPDQGRLSGSANARVLLFAGDQKEWGIGGNVTLLPGERGEGLSLALQPSFGQTNTSLSSLHLDPFSFSDPTELAISTAPLTARFNAELAYGFPTGNHALLTPYIDAHLAHNTNTYTTGLRYQLDSGLDLDLSASHRTRSSGNNDNRFFLQLRSDL